MDKRLEVFQYQKYGKDFTFMIGVWINNNFDRSLLGYIRENKITYIDILFFRIKYVFNN